MQKQQLIRTLVLICLVVVPAQAAKVFLQDSASPLGTIATAGLGYGCDQNTQNTTFRQATTSQGSSAVTKTYTPSSTAPPCLWQTALAAGNQFLYWATPPLSAPWTPSGDIDYQAGCAESNTSTNAGFRFKVMRWNVATGGIEPTPIDTSSTSLECNGSNRAIAAAAPDSTPAFAVGDRIIIIVETMNVGTWGGNNSRTVSLVYGAASGVYGDTFVNFADTISFASDTNNARARVQ
jgi:hypothetical protein